MTVITWNISQLDSKPQEDGYQDCVVTAHWRCTGVDGAYTGSVYSTCSFPPPEGDFTPYPDLTLEQVLGWIWENGVDKVATEAAVASQIEAQKNPPIVNLQLPWITQ